MKTNTKLMASLIATLSIFSAGSTFCSEADSTSGWRSWLPTLPTWQESNVEAVEAPADQSTSITGNWWPLMTKQKCTGIINSLLTQINELTTENDTLKGDLSNANQSIQTLTAANSEMEEKLEAYTRKKELPIMGELTNPALQQQEEQLLKYLSTIQYFGGVEALSSDQLNETIALIDTIRIARENPTLYANERQKAEHELNNRKDENPLLQEPEKIELEELREKVLRGQELRDAFLHQESLEREALRGESLEE